MSIAETLDQTRVAFAEIEALLSNHSDEQLLQAPEGKWHCLQQSKAFGHLSKATLLAYKMPGFAVGLVYGEIRMAWHRAAGKLAEHA